VALVFFALFALEKERDTTTATTTDPDDGKRYVFKWIHAPITVNAVIVLCVVTPNTLFVLKKIKKTVKC